MKTFKRKLVGQLCERLAEPRRFIQIISGPRQTGKTTAVLQALEECGLQSRFASADDPSLNSVEWIRNEWEQARLEQKRAEQDFILVIDEIQKIPQWSGMVKLLWDEDSRRKNPLKIILTGSSTLLLQKGLKESLAGRFELLYCPHWNFAECKEAFGYTLEDFLYFGGYPGAAILRKNEERWARYIGNSIVEPSISQDILFMEEIRKPALMKALFTLGASYSAQEISYTKILGQLQDAGNTVTIAHYLELLAKANIICGLQKFSENKLKVKQSSPRFMVFDTSLMTYSCGASRKSFLENATARGHLTESATGAYLLSRSREEGFDVYWWRDRDKEVDFVLQKGKDIVAIEVKSGRAKHIGGYLDFKKKYPKARGFVIGASNCSLEDFLLGKLELF
ncbi:MAG: ATP-binding protein [Fibromonadales bacterium]|nr:ATP-binding protein [Fibromonadales bacterium]